MIEFEFDLGKAKTNLRNHRVACVKPMKKNSQNETSDDLRSEYDLANLLKKGNCNLTYEIKKDSRRLVREEQKIYDARGEGILARKRKRFRLIDVFAGAGGMTLGFSKMFGHPFDFVWANDCNADCVREAEGFRTDPTRGSH